MKKTFGYSFFTKQKQINLFLEKNNKKNTVTYSESILERLDFIFNFRTNFFQRILYFTHNNFEINIFFEKVKRHNNVEFKSFNKKKIEYLFIQFITVYEISKQCGIDFIDYEKFAIQRNNQIKFLICLDKKENIDINNIISLFKYNNFFKKINIHNYIYIFKRLVKKYSFKSSNFYFYKYNDFASNLLNFYKINEVHSVSNIKIKIETENDIQKNIIKINIFNYLLSDDIYIHDIDSILHYFHQNYKNNFSKNNDFSNDLFNIIKEFEIQIKHSPYRVFILIIDKLKNDQEIEFIKYFINCTKLSNIIFIFFCENRSIDFDLILKENPRNYLGEYILLNNNKDSIEINEKELNVLKKIIIFSNPIPNEKLPILFQHNEIKTIKRLRNKNYIASNQNEIFIKDSKIVENINFSENDEKNILKSFIKKYNSPFLKIKYFIKINKISEIYNILKMIYLNNNNDFLKIKNFLLSYLYMFSGEIKLIKIFLEILIKERDLANSRKIIYEFKNQDPVYFDLKLALLYKLEKDYQRMNKILCNIDGQISHNIEDEYLYLKYIYFEKVSNFKNADFYRKKIKEKPFIVYANIQFSDRLLYSGEFKKAEILLNDTIDYLNKKKYYSAELEARSQMAKLLREKGFYNKSEKLYKNIFLKSEIKNYSLLSAFIAVDIGNLFFIQDQFYEAEFWYKRAFKIFQADMNMNGKILVESNLVEIYKIKGLWNVAENNLKSSLKYDTEKKLLTSSAIDLFNISHLEYLRRNYTKALELIERASKLFIKKNKLNGIVECEFLKILILLSLNVACYETEILKKYYYLLSKDQRIILNLFKIINNNSFKEYKDIIKKKFKSLISKTNRFYIMVFFIQKYKLNYLLNDLRLLSIELSEKLKNYFYFEYYWVFFNLIESEDRMNNFEQDIFVEMYYFFLRNKRVLTQNILNIKMKLDEKNSFYNFFDSVKLMGDYLNWKIPEDFFKTLCNELAKKMDINLIKLELYENSESIFYFSNKNEFDLLSKEIISDTFCFAEELNLNNEEIKKKYNNPDKLFYPYKNTKIFFWKISETLIAILFLGFYNEKYYNMNVFENYRDLFSKFSSLFLRYYENDFKFKKKLDFIIGESKAINKLKSQILRVSCVDFSLLITGESGSGKELVAKAVHLLSNRSKNLFVPVNAAAIPENLLETELFGYKKGAFTGAYENRMGVIESANNGTLFLDEIADIPLNLQAKLLRVIQEKEIKYVGENVNRKVNIRLISATNRDLTELIKNNLFREDLFFRIQDLSIHIPPLRERRDDISLLTQHFLKKYGFKIKNDLELIRVIEYFKSFDLKGNVRELESRIKRLITFYPDFEDYEKKEVMIDKSLKSVKANFEKSYVTEKLIENNWNKVKTARQLKISRVYLFDLIKKYNINLHREKIFPNTSSFNCE